MKLSRFMFFALLTCPVVLFAQEIVKISSYNPQTQDATAAIQAALDSGAAKVLVDKVLPEYRVTTLKFRSNQEVIFQRGVRVRAIKGAHQGVNDCLLLAKGVQNLIVRGEGDVRIEMNKSDYQDSKLYRPSEHRHLFPIIGCDNVVVRDLTLASSGGDGLYISGDETKNWSSNVLIENVISENHHRQGCSIISAEHLKIRKCIFRDTRGTPPAAGIDLEPNNTSQKLVDCVIEDCKFVGNAGGGFGAGINYTLSAPVSITFRNCIVEENPTTAISIWVGGSKEKLLEGDIYCINCKIRQKQGIPLQFNNIRAGGVRIHFQDCEIDNRNSDQAAILLNTQFPDDVDGIDFGNLLIRQKASQPVVDIGALGAAKLYPPQGNIIIENETGERKAYDLVALASKHAGDEQLRNFLSTPLDTKGLKPVADKGNPQNTLRLRGEHNFLQYGKAGVPMTLTFTVPWHRDTPIHIPVTVRDSYNTFVAEFILTEEQQIFSFTPQYDSVFAFHFRTHWVVNVSSPYPGQGYDCSKRLGLMSCESDFYFIVPAGLEKINIEIWGDMGEKVQGKLYSADGELVDQTDYNFGVMFLTATRAQNASEEIWRIHVKGDEDHAVRLGSPLQPILFTSPENILK